MIIIRYIETGTPAVEAQPYGAFSPLSHWRLGPAILKLARELCAQEAALRKCNIPVH